MHIIVTKNIFIDEFNSCRPDSFNYAGLSALFDYFDDMDSLDTELDVIAICCEFSQYDCTADALEACGLEDREELENSTLVIECDDGTLIIQNF